MNKQSSWEECVLTNASLKITPDGAKANSLIDTAKGRIVFLDQHEINLSNANYIFEGFYSSVLEILHALLLIKGYKVSNHICLGYYLRDVLEKQSLFRTFDDCRFKRNSLIYYGRKMDLDVAKKSIKDCKSLLKKIESLIK